METLIELFGASSKLEAIYWLMAVGSSAMLGIRLLLGTIGIELDHELDFDIAGMDVSLSSFVAFVCIAGWTGVLGFNMPTPLTKAMVIGVSSIAGGAGFFLSLVLFKQMKNLENNGNLEIDNAIGKVGKVYLGIPGERNGPGQVEVVVQGRLTIMDALTDGATIITGQKVLVYATEGDKLLVESYDEKAIEEGIS
ncbi:hypothetical protein R9C00_17595 [Flammeovirgaceae bacterium SG7u.111]|nr:hypothetical protein [Flammeovirgaceae bacterium SG7u.132]WPO33518.1 hypothetical protein R9C00_17595 [Flammeovirgaceae bacterium SG7u.111]